MSFYTWKTVLQILVLQSWANVLKNRTYIHWKSGKSVIWCTREQFWSPVVLVWTGMCSVLEFQASSNAASSLEFQIEWDLTETPKKNVKNWLLLKPHMCSCDTWTWKFISLRQSSNLFLVSETSKPLTFSIKMYWGLYVILEQSQQTLKSFFE